MALKIFEIVPSVLSHRALPVGWIMRQGVTGRDVRERGQRQGGRYQCHARCRVHSWINDSRPGYWQGHPGRHGGGVADAGQHLGQVRGGDIGCGGSDLFNLFGGKRADGNGICGEEPGDPPRWAEPSPFGLEAWSSLFPWSYWSTWW